MLYIFLKGLTKSVMACLLCLREALISQAFETQNMFVVLSSLSSMWHALISDHATETVRLFNMQIPPNAPQRMYKE